MLLDQNYTFALDWWALGIVIFEMNFQLVPFRGEDEDEIYDAILGDDPIYPVYASEATIEVCQKLLVKVPEQRLGSGPTDAQEVMGLSYFDGINWDDLYYKRVSAPYKPSISSEKDTSYFDPEYTSMNIALSPPSSREYYLVLNPVGFFNETDD